MHMLLLILMDNLKTATASDLFDDVTIVDEPKSKDTYKYKNQENYGERKRIKP